MELLGVSDTTEVVIGGVTELELGAINELLDFSMKTLLEVGGATEVDEISELLGVTTWVSSVLDIVDSMMILSEVADDVEVSKLEG